MAGKKRLFIGFPSGYGACRQAYHGVYTASSRLCEVRADEVQSSLLAFGFNTLWCHFLNSGDAFDYFAMLHSDIGPDPWWADTLIGELEAGGFDIVSAVVPIKSPEGVTSTAVDDPADPFRPARRLTMREVFALPETFTASDVCPGRALLINTGCWLARRGPWMREVCFTVRDRIVEDAAGRLHAEADPEDWGFSRQAHRLGLKVAATRKVGLDHFATGYAFNNRQPWGAWDTDGGGGAV